MHLIQCMRCNDPKEVNKALEVKPRSPKQQNIDVQLEAVHQPASHILLNVIVIRTNIRD